MLMASSHSSMIIRNKKSAIASERLPYCELNMGTTGLFSDHCSSTRHTRVDRYNLHWPDYTMTLKLKAFETFLAWSRTPGMGGERTQTVSYCNGFTRLSQFQWLSRFTDVGIFKFRFEMACKAQCWPRYTERCPQLNGPAADVLSMIIFISFFSVLRSNSAVSKMIIYSAFALFSSNRFPSVAGHCQSFLQLRLRRCLTSTWLYRLHVRRSRTS